MSEITTSPFFPSELTVNKASKTPFDTDPKKPSRPQTVATVLVELLFQAGVRKIFGVAGDALNGLTDALRRDGRIAWIGCRHEENAAYAAYATAELTGGLGVCAGTVGPGALHLLNGLYNAKREGGSVLAITGQVPTHERGTDYFQEVDLMKVFDDVCAFQAQIGSAPQMLRLAEIAIQTALGDKTVTRLEIPIDVMTKPLENLHFYHKLVSKSPTVLPAAEKIAEAAELLNSKQKIALLCGIGTVGARKAVLELSERLNAPIAHTLRAKDIFDGAHRNVVGLTGLIGSPPAYHAVLDCDLLLMIGTNFPYENFLPVDVPIIQLDRKIENLGRRAPVTVGVLGSVEQSLAQLLPLLKQNDSTTFLDAVVAMSDKSKAHLISHTDLSKATEPLQPPIIAKMIGDIAAEDAIFTVDVGEGTVWAARYIEMRNDRRMIGSFNHGSMGCALPEALGAASLDPDRQVWALCGDGGFAMAMQDFITAVRFDWPIKVVVFNNSELGFVKMENEVSGYPLDPAATKLLNPNFAEFAQSCGAVGIRVEHKEDIERALKDAVLVRRPVLLDVIVSPGELTLPPHIGFKQMLGFGASKVKEGLLGLAGDHEQWENWKKEFDIARRKI
jgi:pyruvate dehydrogenase (quinone)